MSATAPSADASPTAPAAPDGVAASEPQLWWLGCHGGAGTSTIAYLTGVGHDCRQALPRRDFERLPHVAVALVFRISASGVWAAQHSVQALGSLEHRPRLLGFIGVAAHNRRPSRLVQERLQLLRAQVPRLWTLPWIGAFLNAHDPAAIGALPPSYQGLAAEVADLLAAPPQAEAHEAA